MGALIEITNPELEMEEIGQVLEELRIFDEDFKVIEGTSVNKKDIHYGLKYDESTGVIFSISKVND